MTETENKNVSDDETVTTRTQEDADPLAAEFDSARARCVRELIDVLN